MTQLRKVLVIGGGASGMMAAIAAARRGASALVVERMQRVGKKLLATGNGRCNFTNTNLDVGYYHGASRKFVLSFLRQFDLNKTLRLFEELGVVPKSEDDGRVFPVCDQASSVLDVLRYEMARLNVEIVPDTKIQKVEGERGRFVCLSKDKASFEAHSVIIATGGRSSPTLGSNGGGFKIARALGHNVVRPFPALVQVVVDAPFTKRLKGVSFQGVARVVVDGVVRRREQGEILFTDYGLSGVPVLNLSRHFGECVSPEGRVSIGLDLLPEMSEAEVQETIASRWKTRPDKPLDVSFVGWIHKRLIPVILKEAGIEDLRIPCAQASKEHLPRIAACLKNWKLTCSGTQSWMFSQVTAGGVDTREIDRRTMESKIVPGVYFAGEVVDVDGDSGGYNLQWAWSSGHVAGVHAAHHHG